ncbi:MAG: rRNA (Uracil-5-)-methyltransferase [Chlamydiales bacterium]|nr:rRNA (Uracil-5-)-methyltransferase [Chlamydiales bacterium]
MEHKSSSNLLLQGTISDVAFGGEGIMRNEGLVVFAPFTAPEDEVEIAITQKKKSFARGVVTKFIKSSHLRRTPLCPHFSICGGCQLQHLPYEQQLHLKQKWVADALAKIGKITLDSPPPIIRAPKEWEYRRKIRLKLQYKDSHYLLGYISHDQTNLLPIQTCPIFNTDNSIFANLKKVLDLLPAASHTAEIGRFTLLKYDFEKYLIHIEFNHSFPNSTIDTLLQYFSNCEMWIGGLITTSTKKYGWGLDKGTWQVGPLHLEFSPLAFIQNFPEQSLVIYQRIEQIVIDLKVSSVLDLYCGIGATTLLIGNKGIKAHGVESNADAIECAKQNQIRNKVSNVAFSCSTVEQALKNKLKQLNPDLIIVNPPRVGLSPLATELLLNYKPKHLLYISCMPATLARDIAKFKIKGYKVTEICLYDMFPQTTHVETLILLSL